ncbi:MAG: ribosome biogenesis GTP-binding protein YihA/YsxC [Candidatus Pacebacteria bacterium]|nr:ribosome biogenesis GTP-binding protein YihA/YsxC [Candidatus Paceibacterota bacterium]
MNTTGIKKAEFVTGVVGEEAILYDGTPQIAFIGRSNVGKSSTLNALLGRNKLVKVGNTPGKTREINFFKVETDTGLLSYFVDLPGYGYAKLSKQQRNELKKMIRWYISHPEADTALICLIIDAKAGITDIDLEFIELMKESDKEYCIAVNKIDKINQKTQSKLQKDLVASVGNAVPVFYYSAFKGKNIHKLQDYLFNGKEQNTKI